jgi:hypothetical protein
VHFLAPGMHPLGWSTARAAFHMFLVISSFFANIGFPVS